LEKCPGNSCNTPFAGRTLARAAPSGGRIH
jgi:hypothetical protein